MSAPVITVENLGKRYLVGHQSAQRERYSTLRDVLMRNARDLWRKTADVFCGRQIIQGDEVEEFWALRDVSFEVRWGEVVGIIGRNGAGKTTLLKILSRITEPTVGRVTLWGRVASLLEVGTGFHPELTGRENIYLNGAILGMTRAEIRRKFDEIVAFAGVEKFLDTPVKRYSSGMYVRLAFAVAAHLEPEILVVDEVLAVGDAEFQKRCLGKMQDVAGHGRTVLVVSHNMALVRHICTRAIYLDLGRVVVDGTVEQALGEYLRMAEARNGLKSERRQGDGRLRFTDFWVENDRGERVGYVASGEPCVLVFSYRNFGCRAQDKVDVGFGLHLPSGERLLLLYASHMGQTLSVAREHGQFRCRLPGLPLPTGRYGIFPRIEINGVEADFPLDGVGWIDVEELDFYGTGRRMVDHSHGFAPYLIKGEWSEGTIAQPT
ncbi:MAG: ABC transporter ATP-binding protein [Verrucomicrobiae bacterium]|nr:ABC transporter ATP-binding protein [Verrucomicrobiae bacterium]MDW8308250.1 ABC transporter ATP-binding protein [Verrucomicrobiales bacterium]